MSLDVGLVESVVDLQSIVPSIAFATFVLGGSAVRSEVKEQGEELKKCNEGAAERLPGGV